MGHVSEEDSFLVSSVSPLEVVEVLILESSGDVLVVPEALDCPSEINTNTDGGGANESSDDHAPFSEDPVPPDLYQARPMVASATPTFPQKLSWLILHERKAVFMVVSTLASFHLRTAHTYRAIPTMVKNSPM